MSKELNSNKLNGKDLINAGIFSAIYVVIIMLVACTVGMITSLDKGTQPFVVCDG